MLISKFIRNDRGVSLVEVIAASSISIIIAMGVMQINENAQKGMNQVREDSDLISFKQLLKGRLSKTDVCMTSMQTATGTTPVILSATRSLVNGLNTGIGNPEFVLNSKVNDFQDWTVTDAYISAFANNNGGEVGECPLLITVERSRERRSGVQKKTIKIPMTCIVNNLTNKYLTKCSPTLEAGSGGDTWWGTESGVGGDILTFSGISGDPLVRIGSGGNFPGPETAALTLDPGGNVWTPPSGAPAGSHALAIPSGAVLSFGDNDTVGLWTDNTAETLFTSLNFNIRTGYSMTVGPTTVVGGSSITTGDYFGNNYFYSSDERYKKEIEKIVGASDKLSELRGVTYFMRADEFPERNFSQRKQFGLIAQEVQKVFPELVNVIPGTDGYMSVQYGNFVAILIEAFKEQKEEIIKNRELIAYLEGRTSLKDMEQDARLDNLERENRYLRKELKKINQKLQKILNK